MTRTRLGLALATAVAALAALTAGAVTAPAHADSVGVGEAPETGVPAHLDLTGMDVDNRQRRLDVRLGLDTFAPRRTSAYAIIRPAAPRRGPTFVVGWNQLRDEPEIAPGRLFVRLDRDGVTPVRCPGATIRPRAGAGTLAISIPQRCLGRTAGTVRVSALTEDRGGSDADDLGPVRLRRG